MKPKHTTNRRTYLNRIKIAALAMLMLAAVPVSHAAFYDFGTLDVQPITSEQSQNQNWFVEYLQPSQQVQRQIRVSNFDSKEKNLSLYVADTATNEGKDFAAKSPEENSPDIASWIKLPAENLVLASGESKILSVNFVLPKNAGVGLHTAAIIVRENGEVNIEKGVRVYLNVTGAAITASEINSATVNEGGSQVSLDVTTSNLGTTDYKTNYTAELRSLNGETLQAKQSQTLVKPGEALTESIALSKPSFGFYQLHLESGNQSALVQTTLFVPWWMAIMAIAATFAAARTADKKTKVRARSLAPAFGEIFNSLKSSFRTLELQRSAAYFGMFALVAVTTMYIVDFDATQIKSQVIRPQVANSYELTVKWGNLRGLALPQTYRKNWEGKISFTNAHVTIMELLHFERGDTSEIKNNGAAVNFKVTSGPDNDGIILKIEPTGTEVPIVTYENYNRGTREEFKITDFLSSPGLFADTVFATSIKTELGPEHVLQTMLQELEATAELEATPPPTANIPELENLFVEDLPATPEVLAEFIFNSDYVEEIRTERKTTQIDTDSILMEALQATPNVLEEIAASPNLNFIFIPSETVNFPPQEFSFQETRLSSENLGTMIFVQNKDTPWNTYVGTTDFVSLSDMGTIPASALTVIPGEATVINEQDGADIQTGNARAFNGTFDKSVLVNVDPGEDSQQIFILNPVLQVRVPPGTVPGRYRGTLTVTSL